MLETGAGVLGLGADRPEADGLGAYADGVFFVDLTPRRDAEQIVRAFASVMGLALGKGRPQGRLHRRARAGDVTRTIKDAIKRIASESPALAAHLDEHLRTGTFCFYRPPTR